MAIRIMEGCGNRVSCRNLFKKLKILPLTSQYILSPLMFVVQNKNFFLTNNEKHGLDTRQRNNLYLQFQFQFLFTFHVSCTGKHTIDLETVQSTNM